MLTELIDVPGGSFRMGSTSFYPEEAPVHTVTVAGFAIERHPVTNAQFAEFVSRTGYVTVAEQPLDPALYPGVAEADLQPGGLVFRPTAGPVDLRNWRQWWAWVPGASWRRPFGPDSDVDIRPHHPVVQVAYPDALAYARWAGRRLPSEAEWEYAAKAGSVTVYPWGDEAAPGGRVMANTWQGRFPYRNDGALGWSGTSPVGVFPANAFGLLDMIGNVWEWTTTRFSAHHRTGGHQQASPCCAPIGPASPCYAPIGPASPCCAPIGPASPCCAPIGPADPAVNQTLKGGSHLCAPEYCHRYRPAARSPQSQDSATTHIGFRCVADR
ncbi:MAG: formylglycine-generating enzyme family protein [Mycobacteriaceae bacterium]|nr:formylglycine-generating enzyme family protein [Mycobacteriaceae bacterium]